jgi:peptide/nickel transport system substrate-binding protein
LSPRWPRALAALALLLNGCTGQSGASVPGGDDRDPTSVLRIAAAGLIPNPTPQASSGNAYQYLPLYDSLTTAGPGYSLRPSLAESWELLADGATWRFKLRSDATFSDGSRLTAEDAAFTMNEAIAKGWAMRAHFPSVAAAKAPDAATLDVISARPDVSVPNGTPAFFVVSKRAFEAAGLDGFIARPVGSGPYELAEFRPGDVLRYRLRATQHAFRKPASREILIRNVPDHARAIEGLRAGEYDLAPGRAFSADQADALKGAGFDVRAQYASQHAVTLLQGAANSRQTPLRDARVRQALNYAIDREAIAKSAYREYGAAIGQLGAEGSQYFDPSAAPWPHDPARARQLLAQAGFPTGFKLDPGFDYTLAQVSTEVAAAVQANLRSVGVEAAMNQLDSAAFIDRAYGRNSQAQSDGFFGATSDPTGYAAPMRHVLGCGRPIGTLPERNWYCNPEWDRLLDAALAERDPQRRAELFRSAIRLQREDSYALFLFASPAFTVAAPKLRGLEIESPHAFGLDGAYRAK